MQRNSENESLTVLFPHSAITQRTTSSVCHLTCSTPFVSLSYQLRKNSGRLDTCLREEVRRPFILNLTANIAFRNQFLACTCAFQTDPITEQSLKKSCSKCSLRIENPYPTARLMGSEKPSHSTTTPTDHQKTNSRFCGHKNSSLLRRKIM